MSKKFGIRLRVHYAIIKLDAIKHSVNLGKAKLFSSRNNNPGFDSAIAVLVGCVNEIALMKLLSNQL